MSALSVNKDTIEINGTNFPRPTASVAARAGGLAEGKFVLISIISGDAEFVTHGLVDSVSSSLGDLTVKVCPVRACFERATPTGAFLRSKSVPWETEFRFSDTSESITHFCTGKACDRRLAEIYKACKEG
jgi:hypothetical protein